MSLALTPDAKYAVVGGFQGDLALLDLGDLALGEAAELDALRLRAELLAGQRLHEGGGTVNLSAEEWLDRWRALCRQSPAADIAEPHVDLGAAPSAREGGPDTSAETRVAAQINDLPSRFYEAADLLGAGRVAEAIARGRELIPILHRAVDQNPDDPSLRHRLALALVLAGDREGYRRASAATLERLGRSEDPLIGEAARACVVGPGAVDDFSVPRRLVEQALAREPGTPWLPYFLGLVDFRAGRYQGAVEHLGESLKLGGGWAATPLNYPVLAMAHHRLGHRDESRRWLEKAHGLDPGAAIRSSAVWWDRVEFRLLLREADALMLDADLPADPFAP